MCFFFLPRDTSTLFAFDDVASFVDAVLCHRIFMGRTGVPGFWWWSHPGIDGDLSRSHVAASDCTLGDVEISTNQINRQQIDRKTSLFIFTSDICFFEIFWLTKHLPAFLIDLRIESNYGLRRWVRIWIYILFRSVCPDRILTIWCRMMKKDIFQALVSDSEIKRERNLRRIINNLFAGIHYRTIKT